MKRGAERLLFVAAISAAAFLIFLVQPIVGKRILPWYGGAPGVWTLCLAFYQTMLFLGYAYAHLLIRFAAPVLQLGVHAVAVALAICLLPVLPGDGWRPREVAHPSLSILAMLAANVALPFLVLAATGPLVQAWFARRQPRSSPYPLYAFSNLGSLAALLAFPFVIEPRFALSRTGDGWGLAFAGAGGLVLACAALAVRAGAGAAADAQTRPRVERARLALWFLLAACAVVLLMGVTNELCIDIASVAFLWIAPLATYLATFVVCFASEALYKRALWVGVAALAFLPTLGLGLWAPWADPSAQVFLRSPGVQIASWCVLLFAVCMILHGELYRLRPPAGSLTAFYLCVSAGGALGGIFVGILAPLLFDDYHEVGLGFALACLLLLVLCAKDPASWLRASAPRWRWVAVGALALAVSAQEGWSLLRGSPELIRQERSFFGVYRVFEVTSGGATERSLRSGSTVHGVQLMGDGRRVATAYFGRATGLGLVLGDPERAPGARIGVVGLGVGTLASWTRAGDAIRFYEIDPVVVRLARDEGLFHYLEDSEAPVEIVVGDARLALAEEQARGAPQAFDYLIVDAFNSDAIPVHLLTVEAFAHYLAALAPGGLLAVHASSRNFDLMPLVARVGLEAGLYSLQITNERAPGFTSKPSQWVWLSRDRERIRALAGRVRERNASLGLEPQTLQLLRAEPAEVAHVPVWTDDYSDLFGVLRRRRSD